MSEGEGEYEITVYARVTTSGGYFDTSRAAHIEGARLVKLYAGDYPMGTELHFEVNKLEEEGDNE